MDEKRSGRWFFWSAGTLALLVVLYVASFGPACWLVAHGWLSVEPAATVYAPLFIWDSTPELLHQYASAFVPGIQERVDDLFGFAWGNGNSLRMTLWPP